MKVYKKVYKYRRGDLFQLWTRLMGYQLLATAGASLMIHIASPMF